MGLCIGRRLGGGRGPLLHWFRFLRRDLDIETGILVRFGSTYR